MPTIKQEESKLHKIQRQIKGLKKERRANKRIVRRHQNLRHAARAALALTGISKAQRDKYRAKAASELKIIRRHRKLAQQNLEDIRHLRVEAHKHNWLIRKIRHNRKVIGTKGGLTWVDGHQVATWVAEILLAARRDGVHFTVTSGIRTYAQALYFWNNAGRLGLVHYVSVAYPCTSNHCGYIFPKGAADCAPPWQLIEWLRREHAHGRHLALKSYHDTVGSRDDVHFSHTGH